MSLEQDGLGYLEGWRLLVSSRCGPGIGAVMTLEELAKETLVQKNRRLRQEKCEHEEVFCSTVSGPGGTFQTRGCFDCGKSWRIVADTGGELHQILGEALALTK